MLPLALLTAAKGHPILVEIKNGETYNGHLVDCDNFMNVTLKEVILTSSDGENFFRFADCYIKGNNIKYLRVPDEILAIVKEDEYKRRGFNENRGRGDGNSYRGRGTGNRGRGDAQRGRGGNNSQGGRGDKRKI